MLLNGLCNDAVSRYTVQRRNLPGGTEENPRKTSAWIAGVMAEIRTMNIPNGRRVLRRVSLLGLIGFEAVETSRWVPWFQRRILPPIFRACPDHKNTISIGPSQCQMIRPSNSSYFTLTPRVHQGNWQPQRNHDFRELLSAWAEHMLLNGAAQIEETATQLAERLRNSISRQRSTPVFSQLRCRVISYNQLLCNAPQFKSL
jgi:hypothetical protein